MGQNSTGQPWSVTDNDIRLRQTPQIITSLAPTLCVVGPVIIAVRVVLSELSQAARYREPCVNGDWLCKWERAIFDPLQNRHLSTDHQKFVTGDYVGDPYSYAKLGAHPSTGDFWAHG